MAVRPKIPRTSSSSKPSTELPQRDPSDDGGGFIPPPEPVTAPKEFTFEEGKIRGPNHTVYLGNLCREVRGAAPERRDDIIQRFVTTLCQPARAEIGHETWDGAQGRILPLLKPRNYIDPSGPTQHLLDIGVIP